MKRETVEMMGIICVLIGAVIILGGIIIGIIIGLIGLDNTRIIGTIHIGFSIFLGGIIFTIFNLLKCFIKRKENQDEKNSNSA